MGYVVGLFYLLLFVVIIDYSTLLLQRNVITYIKVSAIPCIIIIYLLFYSLTLDIIKSLCSMFCFCFHCILSCGIVIEFML